MDKIFKFLRKRIKKERIMLMAALDLIENKKIDNLDIKKLSGFKKLYRVRVGDFRIIFLQATLKNVIIKIDNRDEQTYSI